MARERLLTLALIAGLWLVAGWFLLNVRLAFP